eukprot:23212_1
MASSKKSIHINECDENELKELPGVGPKIVDRIVAARSTKLFDSVSDLMGRHIGIQQKKMDKILQKFNIVFDHESENDTDENDIEDEEISLSEEYKNSRRYTTLAERIAAREAVISINSIDRSGKKQFKKMLNSIDQSSLIRKLNIPKDITKCIAGLAEGKIKICANQECEKEILVMYNDDRNNPHEAGYKYCDHSDKYFCNEKKCMDLAAILNCAKCGKVMVKGYCCERCRKRYCDGCRFPPFDCKGFSCVSCNFHENEDYYKDDMNAWGTGHYEYVGYYDYDEYDSNKEIY